MASQPIRASESTATHSKPFYPLHRHLMKEIRKHEHEIAGRSHSQSRPYYMEITNRLGRAMPLCGLEVTG